MPMMFVEDRADPGIIVSQVFNFVDVMGGLSNLNVDVLEKFLINRGIIKPKENLKDTKDIETYNLVN